MEEMMVCKKCGDEKELAEFRGGKLMCKKCYAKIRSEKNKKPKRLAGFCKYCNTQKTIGDFYTNRAACKKCICDAKRKSKKSTKICKVCENNFKLEELAIHSIKDNKISYRSYCIQCYEKYKADESTKYKKNNSESLILYHRNYMAEKRQNDLGFKLHGIVAKTVLEMLKKNDTSKDDKSCNEFLEFTSDQIVEYLMNHPEKEWWMNENNHGNYNSQIWNDSDPATWTWQLDHIIPRSLFKYISMSDIDFKICWSLENLRPLSAKQNLLDGATKIRHKDPQILKLLDEKRKKLQEELIMIQNDKQINEVISC